MTIDFGKLEEQIKERGRIEVLDNGATLITENIPGTGLARGKLEILAGSAHEREEDYGVMHFLEHMSFQGSAKFPSKRHIHNMSLQTALTLNASTNAITLTYPIGTGPNQSFMLQPHFLKAFDLIEDVVFHPLMKQTDIDREREIILNELMNRENARLADPYAEIGEHIAKKLKFNNPVFWAGNTLGTRQTLATMTQEKLRSYHSNCFVADNLVACIVADNNGENTLGKIKEKIIKLPKGSKTPPIDWKEERPFNSQEIIEFNSPFQEAHVNIYYQFQEPHKHPSKYNLLSHILGGSGLNSILSQEARDKRRLVYSIGTSFDSHYKTAYLQISYSLPKDRVEASLSAVDSAIKRVKEGRFSPDLVESYKASSLPGILYDFQHPGWIAYELQERHVFETQGLGSTYMRRVREALQLTKKDAVEAANNYLNENRLVVITK